jgi:glutaconate CoA-transferase subunit A
MLRQTVDELVEDIASGMLVAVPRDYSGVSMAATRAIVARQIRGLRLLAVPTSGIQTDVLIGAGCVDELEAAAVSLGELGAGPRFVDAITGRTIRMRDTTCPAVHAALQAAEKGIPFMPLRGLIGSDVLAHRDDWKLEPNPFAEGDDPIVLLPAIRPDVALFHAPRADRFGNVWIGRCRELATMAHAAARTLVTVEEIVDVDLLDDEATAPGALPAMYVSGIAVGAMGAWPLGCQELYEPDDGELGRYAEAARTEQGFADWLSVFLAGPVGTAARR